MKKLYILRHAKSDYPDNVSDDHARPLNKRGQAACLTMGKYLKDNKIAPETILSSDAKRTTETINNILMAAGIAVKPAFTKALYLATPGEMLKEIAKVADSVASIMLVCHNPGAEQLTRILIKSGDTADIERLKQKYPTAALTCLTLGGDSWKTINPASCHLEFFITPKMLG